jgi:hypothetical protein
MIMAYGLPTELLQRITCTVKTDSHTQRLRVTEELMNGIYPRKNSEVVVHDLSRFATHFDCQ